MAIIGHRNVRAGERVPASLREDAARGNAPVQPPPAPTVRGGTGGLGGAVPGLATDIRLCESCSQAPARNLRWGFRVCDGCVR